MAKFSFGSGEFGGGGSFGSGGSFSGKSGNGERRSPSIVAESLDEERLKPYLEGYQEYLSANPDDEEGAQLAGEDKLFTWENEHQSMLPLAGKVIQTGLKGVGINVQNIFEDYKGIPALQLGTGNTELNMDLESLSQEDQKKYIEGYTNYRNRHPDAKEDDLNAHLAGQSAVRSGWYENRWNKEPEESKEQKLPEWKNPYGLESAETIIAKQQEEQKAKAAMQAQAEQDRQAAVWTDDNIQKARNSIEEYLAGSGLAPEEIESARADLKMLDDAVAAGKPTGDAVDIVEAWAGSQETKQESAFTFSAEQTEVTDDAVRGTLSKIQGRLAELGGNGSAQETYAMQADANALNDYLNGITDDPESVRPILEKWKAGNNLSELGKPEPNIWQKALTEKTMQDMRLVLGLLTGEDNIDLSQMNTPALDALAGTASSAHEAIVNARNAFFASFEGGLLSAEESAAWLGFNLSNLLRLDGPVRAVNEWMISNALGHNVDLSGFNLLSEGFEGWAGAAQKKQEQLQADSDALKEAARPEMESVLRQFMSEQDAKTWTETILTDLAQGTGQTFGSMYPGMISMYTSAAGMLGGAGEAGSFIGRIWDALRQPGSWSVFINEAGQATKEARQRYGEGTTDWDLGMALVTGLVNTAIENYETKLGRGIQSIIEGGSFPGLASLITSGLTEMLEEGKQKFTGDLNQDIADVASGRALTHKLSFTEEEALFNVADYLDLSASTYVTSIGLGVAMGGANLAAKPYRTAVENVLNGTATPEEARMAAEAAEVAMADQEAQRQAGTVETPTTEEQHKGFKAAADGENRGNNKAAGGTDARAQAAVEEAGVDAWDEEQDYKREQFVLEELERSGAPQEQIDAQRAVVNEKLEAWNLAKAGTVTEEAAPAQQAEPARKEEPAPETPIVNEPAREENNLPPAETDVRTAEQQMREAQAAEVQAIIASNDPDAPVEERARRTQEASDASARRAAAEEEYRRAQAAADAAVKNQNDQVDLRNQEEKRSQQAQDDVKKAEQRLKRLQEIRRQAEETAKQQGLSARERAEAEKKAGIARRQERRAQEAYNQALKAADEQNQQADARKASDDAAQNSIDQMVGILQEDDQTNMNAQDVAPDQNRQAAERLQLEEEARAAEQRMQEARAAEVQAIVATNNPDMPEEERAQREQEASEAMARREEAENEYREAQAAVDALGEFVPQEEPEQPEQPESNFTPQERPEDQKSELVPQDEPAKPEQPVGNFVPQEKPDEQKSELVNQEPPEKPEDQVSNLVNQEPPAKPEDQVGNLVPQEKPEEQKSDMVPMDEPAKPDDQVGTLVEDEAGEAGDGQGNAEAPKKEEPLSTLVEDEEEEAGEGEGSTGEEQPANEDENEAGENEGNTGETLSPEDQQLVDNANKHNDSLGFSHYDGNNWKPGVTIKTAPATLSQGQRSELSVFDSYAKKKGYTLVVHDQLFNENGESVNGFYRPDEDSGRVIHVALDSENPLRSTMGHELYHMLKELNPEGAKRVAKEFARWANKAGVDINSLVRSKVELYYGQGYIKDKADRRAWDYAYEEVVCDSLLDVIGDQQTVQALAIGDRNLVQRMRDWISKTMQQIHQMLSEYALGSDEARILTEQEGALEKIREVFDKALDETNALQESKKAGKSLGSNSKMMDAYIKGLDAATTYSEANAEATKLAASVLKSQGLETSNKNINDVISMAQMMEAGYMLSEAAKELGLDIKSTPETERAIRALGRYVTSLLQQDKIEELEALYGVGTSSDEVISQEAEEDGDDIEDEAQDPKIIAPDGSEYSPMEEAAEKAHPASGRFSIKQAAQAAGLYIKTDVMGKPYAIVDKQGNEIKKFTVDMIANTPMGTLIDAALRSKSINKKTADKQKKLFADLMTMICQYKDVATVWELVGNEMFSAIKNNSDKQYGTTVDFGTICSKTQAIVNHMSDVMVELGRGLTREEVIREYDRVAQKGLTVPCPVCYVFSRWMGVPSLLGRMAEYQDRFGKMSSHEVQMYVKDLEDQYESKRRVIKKDGKERMQTVAEAINEAKTKVDEKIDKLEAKLEELNKDVKNADRKALDEILKEISELEKEYRQVECYNWVTQVLCKTKSRKTVRDANGLVVLDKNYHAVPKEVLLDLRRTGEFAGNKKYAKSWTYRNTRGAGMGKSILPYSGMGIGDVVYHGANKSIEKKRTPTKNALLKRNVEDAIKAIENTKKNMRAQNMIGGHRFQSTSDFRAEWGLDYVMSLIEMQAVEAQGQLYTKVIEAVPMFASANIYGNLSIMPKGNGYSVVNGKKVLLDSDFSSVTGIDFAQALEMTKKYKTMQMILVGINDDHIRLAMADKRITMIIPWHSSGNSGEVLRALVGSNNEVLNESTDYQRYQNDVERKDRTKEQERRAEVRENILMGAYVDGISDEDMAVVRGSKYLSKMYDRFYQEGVDERAYHAFLNKDQAKQIFPHEYWDTTSTIETADINGKRFVEYCEELGLDPRFSQFKDDPGYWKLLIDRRMYDLEGKYQEPEKISTDNLEISDLPRMTSAKYKSDDYGDKYAEIKQAAVDELRAMQPAKPYPETSVLDQVGGPGKASAKKNQDKETSDKAADEKRLLEVETDIAGNDMQVWDLLKVMREMKRGQDAEGNAKGYWKKDIPKIVKTLEEEINSVGRTKEITKLVTEYFEDLDAFEGTTAAFMDYALQQGQALVTDLYRGEHRAYNQAMMQDYEGGKNAIRDFFRGGYWYISPAMKDYINTYIDSYRGFRRVMNAAGIRVTTVEGEKKSGHSVDLESAWKPRDPRTGRSDSNGLYEMLGGEETDSLGDIVQKVYDAITRESADEDVSLTMEEYDLTGKVGLTLVADYLQAGAMKEGARVSEEARGQKPPTEMDRLREETSAQRGVLQQKSDEIEQLNKEIDKLNNALSKEIGRSSKLAMQLKEMKKNGAAAEKLAQVKAELATANKEKQKAVNALEKAREKLDAQKDELNELRKQLRKTERAYDNALSQMDDLKERRAEQMENMKNRLIEKYKKEAREKIAQAKARQKATKKRRQLVAGIRNTGAKLKNYMAHPNATKGYIPQQNAERAAELIEIMMANDGRKSAAKAGRRLMDSIRDAKESPDYFVSTMYDDELNRAMQEVARILEDKQSLYNLDDAELEIVHKTLKAINHQIQNADKTIGRQKNAQLASEAADGVLLMQRNRESMKGVGRMIRKGVLTHLNPQRFFAIWGHHGDNAITRMGEEASEGQRKKNKMTMGMTKVFEGLTQGENEKKFDKFTGKNATWYDTGIHILDERGNDTGRTWKITEAMRTFFALSWQSDENKEGMRAGVKMNGHEMYQLTIPDEELMKKGKEKEAYARGERVYFTEADANEIIGELTDYEKQWMAAWRDMEKISKQAINETSMLLNGFRKANVGNYVPIFRDPRYIGKEFETVVTDSRLTSMGFLKERVNSHLPMMLMDLKNVINRQVRDVSDYYGFAIPARNLTKIYNANFGGTSFKEVLNKTQGMEVGQYFEKLMADLQGSSRVESSPLDKLRGNVAGAVLSGNPSVIIKQAASYPAAASVLGWKPLLKGLKYFNPAGLKGINVDKIDQYTSALWERRSRSLSDLEANANRNTRMSKTMHWLTNGIQGMDVATTKVIWKAAEYYVDEHNPNLSRGTDEYNRAVARIYEQALEGTQPEYGTMQRPGILRSQSQIVKSLTMYKTQSLQNFNILVDAATNLSDKAKAAKANNSEENQAALKAAKRQMATALSSQITSAVILGVMTAVGKALLHKLGGYRDDKGDLTAESVGGQILKDSASSVAGMVAGGSELFDLINGLIEGQSPFDIEAAGVSTINDLYQNTYAFLDAMKVIGDGDLTDAQKLSQMWPKVRKLGLSVTQLLGLPVGNFANLIDGIAANAADFATGKPGSFASGSPLQIAGTPIIGSAQGRETSNKSVAGYIAQAMMDGDEAEAMRLYNEQLRQGKSVDALNSAIASWQKANIPEIKQAAEAIDNGDLSLYNQLINELTGKGLSMTNAVKYVEAERKKMTAEPKKEEEASGALTYQEILSGMTKETKTSEDNSYTNGMMNSLLEDGNVQAAMAVRDDMLANGKTKSSISSSLSSFWKPRLQEAYAAGDMVTVRQITQMLVQMGLKHTTIQGWTSSTGTSSSSSSKKSGFGSGSFGGGSFGNSKKSSSKKSSFGSGSFGGKGFGK